MPALLCALLAAAAVVSIPPGDAEAYTVDVTVDAANDLEAIDPLVFGGRFEWPGFFNGWPQSVTAQADYYTHIKRWYTYLPIVHETRPSLIRYPGGRAFALTFPWEKSIGRFENRALLTPVEQQTQPDKRILLGIEEAMGAIEDLGAEGAIVAPNLGFCFGSDCVGYPQDNADLVEYLNQPNDGTNPHPDGLLPGDPQNIDWAARRAANGHPAPYNVTYFDIGSETRHSLVWTPQFYASQFCLYCQRMKTIDPTIQCGAVGSDSPYYTDAFWPNPFDRWESWFEDVGNEIAAQCGAEHLSYWQRIDYSPGVNDEFARGWALWNQFTSADIVVDFPTTDTYTMRFLGAGGNSPFNNPMDMGIYLDSIHQTTIVVNTSTFYEVALPVTAGTHTITFRKEDANEGLQYRGVVNSLIHFRDPGETNTFWHDSMSDDDLWDLVQGGYYVQGVYINEPQAFMQGAPSFQTEWGVAFSPPTFFINPLGYPGTYGQGVRDMLNFAGMFHVYVDENIQSATNYQYFEDGWHGLIEGVGTDLNTGEMGRAANAVRRRPNFYAYKLYRDNILDHEIAHTNNTPTYPVGPTIGRTVGDVGSYEDFQIPRLTAITSESADGTEMSIILRNSHHTDDATVNVTVSNFSFDSNVRVQTLTGPDRNSNNEPEPESCSNPPACAPQVSIITANQVIGGSSFPVVVPKHAIVALKFTQTGADKTPPAVPTGFDGSINSPTNTEVTLTWNQSNDPDFDHYNVYKARDANGPYGRVIAQLPQVTTVYVDNAEPFVKGRDYSYAITAVDVNGNESAKTASEVFVIIDDTPPPGGGCVAVAAGAGVSPGAALLYLASFGAIVLGARRRR